jgi:exopolysaccharide production protein ExoZ
MNKLGSIQVMRGVAAVMVLIGHAIAEAEHFMDMRLTAGWVPWTRGVDLFFVISGFIIAVSGRRYFGQKGGVGTFLVRRIVRVVPLYYLFTTLTLITLLVAPGGLKDTGFDPGQILSSYGFYPYAREDGRVAPLLSLGWTLNYEMFFYLVFSACLAFRAPVGLLMLGTILLGLVAVGVMSGPGGTAFGFYTNSILVEFVLGVALAECWLRTRDLAPASFGAGVAILVLGFVLLIGLGAAFETWPRAVTAGLPVTVMIAGPLYFWKDRVAEGIPAAAYLLGDSSYALYLSHRFVLRAVTLALVPVLPQTMTGGWIYIGTVCALAVGTGILVFRRVEVPMLSVLNRRLAGQKPMAGSV